MKSLVQVLPAFALTCSALGGDPGQLLFEDHFERKEAQEIADDPGNGWGTNSKSRAKGHKQVDLRDGAMYIFIHAEANHAVSVTHPAEFTDGTVSLRFMLEDAKDSLGLDFADLGCKEVHAGHLFAARVSPKQVALQDLKTGNMRLDISEARKAKQKLTEEQRKALEGKQQLIPVSLEVGTWHELVVNITGDELSATVDGKVVGAFRSPGIAHPAKKLLRLSVPRNAVVDDVMIWKK